MRPNRPAGRLAGILLFLLFLLVACASSGSDQVAHVSLDVGSGSLRLAGSSFSQTFLRVAFYQYEQVHSEITIQYSIQSAISVDRFRQGELDLLASEEPLSAGSVSAPAGGGVVQIPVSLGAVPIAYNLRGLDGLQLDGPLLAAIYQGQVTSWNDARIRELNPNLSLPAMPIVPLSRADPSGTTYILTDYLSHMDPRWSENVGVSQQVTRWAAHQVPGQYAMAEQLQDTPGTLGYLDPDQPTTTQFQVAAIVNQSKHPVMPTPQAAAAAASQLHRIGGQTLSIVDQPGPDSYPITGYTWLYIPKKFSQLDRGRAIVLLADWMVTSGQAFGKPLGYPSLSASVRDQAEKDLRSVTYRGTSILATVPNSAPTHVGGGRAR